MIPTALPSLMKKHGKLESYPAGQVFHAPDFPETLFLIKAGYAKRYQLTKDDKRVIELIYGPGRIFPTSQLYKKIFGLDQNHEDLIYVYQAMTDIEIIRMSVGEVISYLDKDPKLYIDLFYDSGIKLKSNVNRLASNAIKDDYKKVAYQIACLAEEFGQPAGVKERPTIQISVPLKPIDMAEQLNISVEVADAVMSSLTKNKLISIKNDIITISDVGMLKDIYL